MPKTKYSQRVSVKTATGQVALSPNQVANLRGRIAKDMETHIALADEVIKGHREWTPTQARVFSNLLNKVIPDLSASFHQHEHSHRALNEMSREELERIASGVDEIIDADYEEQKDDGEGQGDSQQPDSGSSADENNDSGSGGSDEPTRPQFSTTP